MKYYLYRVKKEQFSQMRNIDKLEVDYFPHPVNQDDRFIAFVSESLQILGSYVLSEDAKILVCEKDAPENITLRDFYNDLELVKEVTEKTYKMFAKKLREVSEKDFHTIVAKF